MKLKVKKYLKNLDRKIIALLTAVFLWFYVDSISTIQKDYFGKIKYLDMPSELTAIQMPNRLRYTLKTNRYFSDEIDSSEIYFEVSLKGAVPGKNNLEAEIKKPYDFPNHVQIELPEKPVEILMDKKFAKSVKIVPTVVNNLKPDYQVKILELEPATVQLEGAESILKPINEIATEELVVQNPGRQTHRRKLSLNIRGLSRAKPESVTITLQVLANTISQQLYLPLKPQNLYSKLKVKKITPEKLMVEVQGNFSEVKKFDFSKLFCYIDLKEIDSPGKYLLAPRVDNSENLAIEILRTEKVEIELERK